MPLSSTRAEQRVTTLGTRSPVSSRWSTRSRPNTRRAGLGFSPCRWTSRVLKNILGDQQRTGSRQTHLKNVASLPSPSLSGESSSEFLLSRVTMVVKEQPGCLHPHPPSLLLIHPPLSHSLSSSSAGKLPPTRLPPDIQSNIDPNSIVRRR